MIVRIPYYLLRAYQKLHTDKTYSVRKLERIRLNTLYDLGKESYDHPENPHYSLRSHTHRVPLFGPAKRQKIEHRPISVIAPGNFSFHTERNNGVLQPREGSRLASIRPTRHAETRAPRAIYLRPQNPDRPEVHRPRADKKVNNLYRRALRFTDRTYGRYSEIAEFAAAFSQNRDLPEILTALAINEAIDYAYGRRARFLRDRIYSQSWYKLPIGLDAIQTILGAAYASGSNRRD